MHQPPPPLADKGPTGPLQLNSRVYVERPPIEDLAYAAIAQPGSLLRIKAPKQMGKSSLLIRIAEQAHILGYQTCKIDFLQAEEACFASLDSLLRWFCRLSTLQLGIIADLDDWWDAEIGSKVSCTIYFENVLLKQLNQPLVLIVNEVNRIFEYEHVAGDFLSLLRFWHEQAQRSPRWQNLRLVMAYCTEVYVPLKLEQSPFNVGQQLQLPPFTLAQVKTLATRYDLPQRLGADYDLVMEELMALVGGHPCLVHTVIAQLRLTPEHPHTLLAQAAQPSGLLGEYLRQCHAVVRHQPGLNQAVQQLVKAPDGLQLPANLAYQLSSLGIVKFEGDRYWLACELFQRYFANEFAEAVQNYALQAELQQENQRLQRLANTDALTQIPNRRAFDLYLKQTWRALRQTQQPLTMMLCDIDHFKNYNDSYGHLVGDQCLCRVAEVLQDSIRLDSDFVARFGGEEFAVILPNTDLLAAQQRAEELRSRIRQQTILAETPSVTVSIGVAVAVGAIGDNAQRLVKAADQVLYESKRLGRDRVTVISLPSST